MAVQSLEERAAVFDRLPLEVDADGIEELSVPLGGRQVKPRSSRWRWALGALLAGVVVLAVGASMRKRSLAGADVGALQEEVEGVKPFKQCGGAKYRGRTCCQMGCACIIQSRYYSVCQAPGGGQKCNAEKAKSEVMSAKESALETRPAALEAVKAAKIAMKAKVRAKRNLKAAEGLYEQAKAKGNQIRSAKEQKERLVKDAKDEAEAAEEAAKSKLKHYHDVKKEISDMNKTAALRSHGQCGALFANCGPVAPPKLTEYMACCQEGCICKWRDPFYAQCQAPGGGACDPASEVKHVKARKALMAKLLEEHVALEERRKATKEHAEKVDRDADDIRHKAAEAGAERVKAHTMMMRKRAIFRASANDAKRLKASALHKKHTVHYAALAIKAWKKAAAGHKCGKEAED